MRSSLCLYLCLILIIVLVGVDGRKTFSSRRKSGGSSRRQPPSHKQKPPAPPATPHKTDSVNTNFLNFERAGSSHGQTVTHNRGNLFDNKPSVPQPPKQTLPTNGQIGFEKFGNQGGQKLGFDKVNSEVQHKPASNLPSAPAYPAGSPPYPGGSVGRPPATAPNGPPPAYPGYSPSNTGSHPGGFEPPPAYPGRPVNAPPVYSANNPTYPQRNPSQQGVGGYPTQQGGYQQSAYPHQQGSFPNQQGAYPGQSYPGQQNFGYQNTGNFGNYPNQGHNQGFGSYPSGGFGNSYQGGFGQPQSGFGGFGGNSYGGSPFGHSNAYGGSPFGSSGFGGNSWGNSGHNNPHYSPNNFGFSSNPGFFGSQSPYPGYSGNHNNFGYHKKSRFGGLPIPIPIPIPIPLGGFGGFGGFGGHSHNHRLLDTFVKNKNVSTSDNITTNVYILNNATVTPCTSDQFIYESLNVTVLSCTAGNCTAIKVFVTTNVSGESAVHSAGLTMCLEPQLTFSSFADNINPTVSDVHKFWMRVCKEVVAANSTGNVTDQTDTNVTVKITEVVLNDTVVSDGNTTSDLSATSTTTASPAVESTTISSVESSTVPSVSETTDNVTGLNTTLNNSTATLNSSFCETFNCSWIEMCLPSVEIVDKCATPDCPFTRTGYQPCIRIKMCKSPSTPISTFATINTTVSRVNQFNNITSVNDVANLTLISYIPPVFPTNCSENATDPGCQPAPAPVALAQDICSPANSTGVAEGATSNNGTVCIPPIVAEGLNNTSIELTTAEPSTTTPIR